LSATVVLLLVIVAAGSTIAAVTVSQRNQALRTAITAALAANEQNRSAVDAQVDLIALVTRQQRFVSTIQNEREQFLDKAVTRLEAAALAMTNLRRDVAWNPEDEVRNRRTLARAHQARGDVSLSRNQVTDAMAQFRQAEEILARLAAADPADLDMQVNLLRNQRRLAHVSMYRVGDSEAAQRYIQRAIEMSRACRAKKPDNDVYKSELANSLGQVAGFELALGHLEKAREPYREEIAVRESFSPAEAKKLESRRELAGLYAQLAELNVRMGDLVEGRRLYDQCAALRQQVAAEQPNSWPVQNDLALSYNNQGSMRFPLGGDPAAARPFHRKALLVLEKRAEADAMDADNKRTLADTLYYEATCALHAGDKNGAAAGYQRCLKLRQELATNPKDKMRQADLMLAQARCGDHAGAARIAQELVATPPKDERFYVQSACGYALAAGAASGDAVLAQRYTTAALDCLRKAKERGWADVLSLEKDTDLEPIRNDPAFQALLGEFQRPREKRP
jgi:tetratricopeptide (TPR) repeat protein